MKIFNFKLSFGLFASNIEEAFVETKKEEPPVGASRKVDNTGNTTHIEFKKSNIDDILKYNRPLTGNTVLNDLFSQVM